MESIDFTLRPIGYVESPLINRKNAPRSGAEGAPDAWLVLDLDIIEAADDLAVGAEVILITWLHQARRSTLNVHPRGDRNNPLTGVFSTRSPDRPNPVGLHRVRIIERSGDRLKVGPLEAINGTPVVDIKPVLPQTADS